MPSTPLAIFQTVGIFELLIVLFVVAVVFHRRLPALGRQLGAGARQLRGSIASRSREEDEEPEPAAGEVVPEKR